MIFLIIILCVMILLSAILLFRKKLYWASGCVIILGILIAIFLIAGDGNHDLQQATPELVYTGKTEYAGGYPIYDIIYHHQFGPFSLSSYYQAEYINRYKTVMSDADRSAVMDITSDEAYTYLICYGFTISKVTYCRNAGFDYGSLIPFAPKAVAPDVEQDKECPYQFFVYRIPFAFLDDIQ